MLREGPVATETHEDFSEPILPGKGASDYERYLRTDELLALQKTPEERAHPDELLFQTVHQSSELWLKLATSEVARATGTCAPASSPLRCGCFAAPRSACSSSRGSSTCSSRCRPGSTRRSAQVLGHGSGFDSPGFREVRRVTPPLGEAFDAPFRRPGSTSSRSTCRAASTRSSTSSQRRSSNGTSASRCGASGTTRSSRAIIGDQVVGTQGTPVELLGRMIHHNFYPALWRARNQLTARAKEEEA